MKKVLIILIVLITSQSLFSQKKIYYSEDWKETNKENADFYRVIKKLDDSFLIKDYFISGELQFEGVSTNDTEPLNLNGKAVWYFKNGQIKSDAFFKSGKLENSFVGYFPDGTLAVKTTYLNGEFNGELLKYVSPGKLEYRLNYKKGIMQGKYEFFNERNQLYYEGTASNGAKDGICKDYYDDGELRCVYSFKNKRIDGEYIEYSRDKDTLNFGIFKNGLVQSFELRSNDKIRGSIFLQQMNLKNGIEQWKTYRDGKLIMESMYKDGFYHGKWKIYTIDGKKLFQTIDFTNNTTCKEENFQPKSEEFIPYFTLNDRFDYITSQHLAKRCKKAVLTRFETKKEEDPFYHKQLVNVIADVDRNIIKNYIDPSSTKEFSSKNNCQNHRSLESVTVCSRIIKGITYKVFLSEDVEILKQLKKNLVSNDNEIHFFFQQFENRDYDLNKESRPERYMSFSLSNKLKEKFKNELIDDISVVEALEHNFWNISDFSGMSAYSAFKKELE